MRKSTIVYIGMTIVGYIMYVVGVFKLSLNWFKEV